MAARMMLLVLAAVLVAPSFAALPDPTALPVAPAAAGGAAGGSVSPGISLTAIKMRGKQKIAIINGQEITVGGRYQDVRVVRISESEVVLRRGGEITVLKLYPQVEKRLRGK